MRAAFRHTGAGRPIVLLHGLGSDHRQVRSAFPFDDRALLTPDLPGHGATIDFGAGFERSAALVLAMLDHLGIDRFDLGGISMGAGISLSVALSAPERIRRLVLVRPAWLDRPALPQLRLVSELGARIPSVGLIAAAVWLEADLELRSIATRIPGAADAIRAILTRPQAQESALVLPRMVADQPFRNLTDLCAMRCPTLVIGNDEDPLHPAELARTLANAIPHATYEHIPPRYVRAADHAAALSRSARDFLDRDIPKTVSKQSTRRTLHADQTFHP